MEGQVTDFCICQCTCMCVVEGHQNFSSTEAITRLSVGHTQLTHTHCSSSRPLSNSLLLLHVREGERDAIRQISSLASGDLTDSWTGCLRTLHCNCCYWRVRVCQSAARATVAAVAKLTQAWQLQDANWERVRGGFGQERWGCEPAKLSLSVKLNFMSSH